MRIRAVADRDGQATGTHSVGEDRRVVSLKQGGKERLCCRSEDLLLGTLLVEDSVEDISTLAVRTRSSATAGQVRRTHCLSLYLFADEPPKLLRRSMSESAGGSKMSDLESLTSARTKHTQRSGHESVMLRRAGEELTNDLAISSSAVAEANGGLLRRGATSESSVAECNPGWVGNRNARLLRLGERPHTDCEEGESRSVNKGTGGVDHGLGRAQTRKEPG